MPKRERERERGIGIDTEGERALRSKVSDSRSPLTIFTMQYPQNPQNPQPGNSFSVLREYLNGMHIG